MQYLANKHISQTASPKFLMDALPYDIKMWADSIESFNTKLPAGSKWNGMLVYVNDIGSWHTYNLALNKLEPLNTGSNQSTNNVVPNDKLLIWKAPGNDNLAIIETNDIVEGFIESSFVKATYVAGDPTLLASYSLIVQNE
jgi:hypothetical protein